MIDKATGAIVFKDFSGGPALQRAAFLASEAGMRAKTLEREGRRHAYLLDVHERRGQRFELLLEFTGPRLARCSLTVGEERFASVPDILSAYIAFDAGWLRKRCGMRGDGGAFAWGTVERWLDYKNGYHAIAVRYKAGGKPVRVKR